MTNLILATLDDGAEFKAISYSIGLTWENGVYQLSGANFVLEANQILIRERVRAALHRLAHCECEGHA